MQIDNYVINQVFDKKQDFAIFNVKTIKNQQIICHL